MLDLRSHAGDGIDRAPRVVGIFVLKPAAVIDFIAGDLTDWFKPIPSRAQQAQSKQRHIEESFLDDQSNGWNVQRSKVRLVVALSRLWLLLLLETLYLTAQRVDVVARERGGDELTLISSVDKATGIGLGWVQIALQQGWRLLRRVRLPTHHDPDLAEASNPQHRRRRFQFEFQLSTLNHALE